MLGICAAVGIGWFLLVIIEGSYAFLQAKKLSLKTQER